MILIKDLYKRFGKNKVLKGIDLKIEEGGVYAVLGPNGSGKTTLIKSLLGMVLPDEGELIINGQSISKKWLYRDKISYLPQIARFPENLTVNELIRMVKKLRSGTAKDQELIAYFELTPFLNKPIRHLSGGTRQKVNIVIAFMYDCPILMLDEPTAGLDPVAIIKMKKLIEEERQKGKIILFTTHIMSFVEEVAEHVIFLLEGKIHFNGRLTALKHRYEEENLERTIAKILSENATLQQKNNGKVHMEVINITN